MLIYTFKVLRRLIFTDFANFRQIREDMSARKVGKQAIREIFSMQNIWKNL